MKFSILIPSLLSRFQLINGLFTALQHQANGLPVEILALTDNKQRSIGKKREALLKIAAGDYVAFVDDDDAVSGDYVAKILEGIEHGPDVVTFDSLCCMNDLPEVLVSHHLRQLNEEYSPDGFKRAAWHIHAWRWKVARGCMFPDANYGEDWAWASILNKNAKDEYWVGPDPLYRYQFRSEVTEAKA